MLYIKRIDNNNHWKNLSSIWISFQEKYNIENPFLDWKWISSWLEYLPKENILPILLVIKNEFGEIVGLAPFQIRKTILLWKLEAFAQEFCDYVDWLIIPEYEEYAGKAIIEWIKLKRKKYSVIRISNLTEDGIAYRTLSKYFQNQINERGIAPEVDISGSFEEYNNKLNKKFLSDTRRRERKLLKEIGNVNYVKIQDNSEIPKVIENISRWLKRRRNEKGEYSYYDRKYMKNHLISLYKKLNERNMLHLTGLKFGSKYIALNVAFIYKGKILSYTPVFDEKYSKYGVMRLLKFKHIEECFKNKIKTYDFCLGGEQYKYNFNPNIKQLYSLNLYGNNIQGKILKYIEEKIKPVLKKSDKVTWIIKTIFHKAKI